MIDRYDTHMYVYWYRVTDDGKDYNRMQTIPENKFWWASDSKSIHAAIKKILSIESTDGLQFFRTFETTQKDTEKNLNCTDYVTINKVDPNWEKALTKKKGQIFVDFVDKFINKVYE